MKKEQEAKFEKYFISPSPHFNSLEDHERWVWDACCRANGIGEDPCEPSEHGAPEWVIKMIRAGKPVRCKVSNDEGIPDDEVFITGYDIKSSRPYCDKNENTWKYAEPISAWKPKDGEAVLYNNTGIALPGVYWGGSIMHGVGSTTPMMNTPITQICIPYDESKRGNPWSEI